MTVELYFLYKGMSYILHCEGWHPAAEGDQALSQVNWTLMRRILLILTDAVLVNVTVLIAFLVRFDGSLRPEVNGVYVQQYLFIAPWLTGLSLVIFERFGLYRTLWRYAGVRELLGISGAMTLRSVAFWLLISLGHFLKTPVGFPRSVVVMTWLLDLVLIGAVRFSFRVAAQPWRQGDTTGVGPVRTLIYGAGDTGALVLRELHQQRQLNLQVIGLLDDDPAKQGLLIGGRPVLGTRVRLPDLVAEQAVSLIVVAIPSASPALLREVVALCQNLPVRLKILPGIYERVSDEVSLSRLRDVQIEDLLGRDPVQLDLPAIAGHLRDQVVLITGAGGSIGSELCRQVAPFHPKRLVLLGRGEYALFEIQSELARDFPYVPVQVAVADVRHADRMRRVFTETRPDLIFHAAAHKRIEMMEAEPDEAVDNNVFGTRVVAELALEFGVRKFVFISTDKAVNPTSVYGASKRLAERVVRSLEGRGTHFVVVRFGNVLASRGSVIPIFQRQIAAGGPVTITHPDMVRYFMTIPEAAQLVVQAGAMGEGGEVYVLDMGEPVKILAVARSLIRLSGLDPDHDIKIVITGPRPGERLHEELLTAEEGTTVTHHRRIFAARTEPLDLPRFRQQLAELQGLLQDASREALVAKLREMLSTYDPGRGVPSATGEAPPTPVAMAPPPRPQTGNAGISGGL